MVQQLARAEAPLDPFAITWYRVFAKTRETPDTMTIRMRPLNGQPPTFKPGQFSMLYAYGVGEVPISISGDPANRRYLEHTVRSVGAVTGSLAGKGRGELIGYRGPYGRGWPLEEAEGKDVAIVAGGIGLAPLRPAIYHIVQNREKYGKFYVLYGARTPPDLLYKHEIERWRGRLDTQFLVTVDKGDERWRGYIGVVTTLFRHIRLDPANTIALVCGPEIMMKFTVAELKNQGLPEDQIFISMERNMKCGVGLCGHCQFGPYFVCKDGPVFRFSEIGSFFGRREV